MEKISTILSSAVPLDRENVDTDQIIPARFLKSVSREGFGLNLFQDWRCDEMGKEKMDFVLNDPRYAGSILVAGKNFGCGSSREHAAWALYDYGFRAVVSSFFADIFRNNALNNGLLPVQVSETFLREIFSHVKENPHREFRIDLQTQVVSIEGTPLREVFPLQAFRKSCLMNGFDTVDFLVSKREAISQYESKSKLIKIIKNEKEENSIIAG